MRISGHLPGCVKDGGRTQTLPMLDIAGRAGKGVLTIR